MEQAEITEGKKRVREYLIEPLEADGMARTAKTVADHEAFLQKLESALCYLGQVELVSLSDTIRRGAAACAKCRARDGWPSLVTIRNWAHDLRPRPAGYSPKVTSWMRSSAGRRCWLEDPCIAVSAVRYLVKYPGVPTADNGGMRTVRDWAEKLHRDLSIARGRVTDGVADDADRDFIDMVERQSAVAKGLVYPEGGQVDAA